MKTWEEISQEKKVEEILYDLIIKSLDLLLEKEQKTISHFDLFCNIKYVQIQLSVNTKGHSCNDDPQTWDFYQFSTDYEGIRDLWRDDWAEVMNYICDDIYLEYLDFCGKSQELADERLAQIEEGVKQATENVFEKVKTYIKTKNEPANEVAMCALNFQQNYY